MSVSPLPTQDNDRDLFLSLLDELTSGRPAFESCGTIDTEDCPVINGISASLSGLANAQRRLELAASNIANQNTPGYQALRAANVDRPEGGVAIGSITRDPTPGPPRFDAVGAPAINGSNVDPAAEQVNLLLNRRHFEANLKALQVQDELLNSLLRADDRRA